jgi:hypothetical protein
MFSPDKSILPKSKLLNTFFELSITPKSVDDFIFLPDKSIVPKFILVNIFLSYQ